MYFGPFYREPIYFAPCITIAPQQSKPMEINDGVPNAESIDVHSNQGALSDFASPSQGWREVISQMVFFEKNPGHSLMDVENDQKKLNYCGLFPWLQKFNFWIFIISWNLWSFPGLQVKHTNPSHFTPLHQLSLPPKSQDNPSAFSTAPKKRGKDATPSPCCSAEIVAIFWGSKILARGRAHGVFLVAKQPHKKLQTEQQFGVTHTYT